MLENKKILVLGMARSGFSIAKYLVKNNKVVLNDGKVEEKHDPKQVAELRDLGVELLFGSHPDDLLDSSFDFLIKNPGVPIDHKYVLKARELGIEVVNEAEVAYRLLPENVKMISITGTNGKTTTTTLTYLIMKKAFGDKVHLAGNIGVPLCNLLGKVNSGDIIVMEVSAQQLENFVEFRPDVAVMTNLSPAHLEFFKDYEYYKSVKAKIFMNQDSSNVAILNMENEDVLNTCKNIKSNTKYFSSVNEINGCYLVGDDIYYYGEKVISRNDMLLAGIHNVENCMCAIMVCKEFGVKNEDIYDVVSTFTGVEHRLEYVDTINGVKYYNDTEATNIKCTQIALSSFNNPIIIFLGGLERGQDFYELKPYINNVKAIIAIGQCRDRVVEFGKSLNIDTYSYEHLVDGFDKVQDIVESGDIVLLSPASASWDQYKECEERGAEFKNKVQELKV